MDVQVCKQINAASTTKVDPESVEQVIGSSPTTFSVS